MSQITTIVRTKTGDVHRFDLELSTAEAWAAFRHSDPKVWVTADDAEVIIEPMSVESVKTLNVVKEA